MQNKISHLIILWTPSVPKLRGHKGFGHRDCHNETYSLIGKMCIFFVYVNEYVSISQNVLVLANHEYTLNPGDRAKHFLLFPWNPMYSLPQCHSLCLFPFG